MKLVVAGSAALVAAALVLAAAFGRFQIATSGNNVFRLDGLTGQVEVCDSTWAYGMASRKPEWCIVSRYGDATE